MAPNAAEALNPRFQERDNPAGKVWDREPPRTLIDEWREHIRRTGEPDTFRYHCHSKPRTEDPPRIVADGFDVPERFRLSKGLAPCPLCSLHGPKYYRGMLAWWPEEKALRAIGHECGVRYWGAAFVDAKRDFAERQEGDRAGDVLIDALRLTPNLASWIEAIRPRARAIDAARARFNKGLGSGAVADLYRHLGAESQLKLYREFFDPITERRELEVVERLPFKGRQALGKGKAAELLLYRATLALDGLVFPSDNAMLDAVVTWTPKERVEHLRSRMAASRSCDEAYKLCVATQALFSTENLDTLCGWAADHWSLSRLKIRRDRAGRYLLGQGRREIVFINVTPDLMFPLSELRHELP